jgi:hypothetical protein
LNFRKVLKGEANLLKYRGNETKEFLDKATKLRFTHEDMAKKIKYGMPGTSGLAGQKRYQGLSLEGQKHAFQIVDQECAKQAEWAPKQLPRLAKAIERRLKAECN